MKKDFDCVEMKRAGQEALRARLAGMTSQERLEFWAREHQRLVENQPKFGHSDARPERKIA